MPLAWVYAYGGGALAPRRLLPQVVGRFACQPGADRQTEGQEEDEVVRRGVLGLQEVSTAVPGPVKNPSRFLRVCVHGGQQRS